MLFRRVLLTSRPNGAVKSATSGTRTPIDLDRFALQGIVEAHVDHPLLHFPWAGSLEQHETGHGAREPGLGEAMVGGLLECVRAKSYQADPEAEASMTIGEALENILSSREEFVKGGGVNKPGPEAISTT